jgi:nuclear pore complex protein Nup133
MVHLADIFDIALFHAASSMRMLTPSETVGAGCTAQELQSRFPQEELRDPIMHDNLIQDRQLQNLIENCQADRWHAVCVEEAQKKLEEEATANVQEEAAAQQLKQTLEEAEAEADADADANAQLTGATATSGGSGQQDQDEDVQMA